MFPCSEKLEKSGMPKHITPINGPRDFIGHADVLQGDEFSEFEEAMEKVSMQRIDRSDFLSLIERN